MQEFAADRSGSELLTLLELCCWTLCPGLGPGRGSGKARDWRNSNRAAGPAHSGKIKPEPAFLGAFSGPSGSGEYNYTDCKRIAHVVKRPPKGHGSRPAVSWANSSVGKDTLTPGPKSSGVVFWPTGLLFGSLPDLLFQPDLHARFLSAEDLASLSGNPQGIQKVEIALW